MDPVLQWAQTKQTELIQLLKQMVECESPSGDAQAISRFGDLLAGSVEGIGTVRRIDGGAYGPHLLCEFDLPGKKKSGRVLALGHSDTVWPMGTLQSMPWRESDGRLWGPGVLDMKSGLAFWIYAMRALHDLDIPVKPKVALLVVSDEEVGSHSSRQVTEKEARKSGTVLVLEPGTGLEGKLKTARKGVGGYALKVHGVSSHAGVDFAAGASAINELAAQIARVQTFSDPKKGITVNVGVISGGTRTNVVAAEAEAGIDYRIPRLKDFATLERKFRSLKPTDKRCRLELSGELNRPPMERTLAIADLFRTAKTLAKDLGVSLEESSTGGGSDGNFTAALGIRTLDGLGGVGEGAHARHESILVDRIADRTALLAKLVAAL